MSIKTMKLLSLLMPFAALVGCSRPVEPSGPSARIIVNQSIDGVKIGDDTTIVIQKLGRPSTIITGSYADFIFEYNEGPHAGLVLTINDLTDTLSGVVHISVVPPYDGKTAEGVCLGMERDTIIARLGNPTDSPRTDSGGISDRYIFDKVIFGVFYEHTTASAFTLSINREATGGGYTEREKRRSSWDTY